MKRPKRKEERANVGRRLLFGLLCAAIGVGLGVLQPFVCYAVWRMTHTVRSGQDWSGIVPLVLSAIGAVGGGVTGICAGAVMPDRRGIANVIFGLAGVYLLSGTFFVSYANESVLIAWTAFQAVGINLILAFLVWRISGGVGRA